MASIIEHFSSANKTTLENNVTFLTQLTNQCLSGIQKIVALNVDAIATSATITLSQDNSTQMQKVTNYGRQLINIATNTQAEINTTAEAHIAQRKQQTLDITERVARIAPPGSKEAINYAKTALENVAASYEHATQSIKQAADMGIRTLTTTVDSSLDAVDQLSQATRNAVQPFTKKKI